MNQNECKKFWQFILKIIPIVSKKLYRILSKIKNVIYAYKFYFQYLNSYRSKLLYYWHIKSLT